MNPTIGAIPTQKSVFVGLDVHRDTIAACAYDPASKAVCLEVELPSDNRAKLRKVMARIRGSFGEPRCYYEASSCGYTLYRTLRDDGISCAVIAPSSIPRRAGDRVKTDRRDAEKLARFTSLTGRCLPPKNVRINKPPNPDACRRQMRQSGIDAGRIQPQGCNLDLQIPNCPLN